LSAYHNLNRTLDKYIVALLLIGMCMDNPKCLQIPDNFVYVIRTGASNLRNNEFQAFFAVAVGGVNAIAIIGHTD